MTVFESKLGLLLRHPQKITPADVEEVIALVATAKEAIAIMKMVMCWIGALKEVPMAFAVAKEWRFIPHHLLLRFEGGHVLSGIEQLSEKQWERLLRFSEDIHSATAKENLNLLSAKIRELKSTYPPRF